MIYLIAANQCQLESNDSAMAGYVPDPACADGGYAAAEALYPALLSFFQGFPASVWATEAENAASGNYYGVQTPGYCPPGSVFNMTNGVITCTPNAAATRSAAGTSVPINILTGAPITTPPVSTPVSTPAPAPSPAPSPSQPSAPSQTTGTSSTSAAAATSDPFAFLTQDSISGIPNWMLLAGGLALVMILPSLLGGRR
jgi:hypothetical protein